jgi:hypothetical protein
MLPLAIACNNSSSTGSPNGPSSSRAALSLSIQPSPITATHCDAGCSGSSGTSFGFGAEMRVNVRESGGVGATVNTVTLNATVDGVSFPPLVFNADDVTRAAGTNHVGANATLAIPLSIVYNTPSGTANLTISLNVQTTDDRNNQVTATGQVNVQ